MSPPSPCGNHLPGIEVELKAVEKRQLLAAGFERPTVAGIDRLESLHDQHRHERSVLLRRLEFAQTGRHQHLRQIALIGLDDHEGGSFVAEHRGQRFQLAESQLRVGMRVRPAGKLEERRPLEAAELVARWPRSQAPSGIARPGWPPAKFSVRRRLSAVRYNLDRGLTGLIAFSYPGCTVSQSDGQAQSSLALIQVATSRQPIHAIRQKFFVEEIATADESSNETPCRQRNARGPNDGSGRDFGSHHPGCRVPGLVSGVRHTGCPDRGFSGMRVSGRAGARLRQALRASLLADDSARAG